MRIEVLLFAQLAESVDNRQLTIELADGLTVCDALDLLCNEHASIAAMRNQLAIAVGELYCQTDTILHDGQTMALITPVSGG